jgi:hypothetical protein
VHTKTQGSEHLCARRRREVTTCAHEDAGTPFLTFALLIQPPCRRAGRGREAAASGLRARLGPEAGRSDPEGGARLRVDVVPSDPERLPKVDLTGARSVHRGIRISPYWRSGQPIVESAAPPRQQVESGGRLEKGSKVTRVTEENSNTPISGIRSFDQTIVGFRSFQITGSIARSTFGMRGSHPEREPVLRELRTRLHACNGVHFLTPSYTGRISLIERGGVQGGFFLTLWIHASNLSLREGGGRGGTVHVGLAERVNVDGAEELGGDVRLHAACPLSIVSS